MGGEKSIIMVIRYKGYRFWICLIQKILFFSLFYILTADFVIEIFTQTSLYCFKSIILLLVFVKVMELYLAKLIVRIWFCWGLFDWLRVNGGYVEFCLFWGCSGERRVSLLVVCIIMVLPREISMCLCIITVVFAIAIIIKRIFVLF